MPTHEVQVGNFYLRKKCRSVVRLVVREIPGLNRRKFVVHDFFIVGGELADEVWEDRILVWGERMTAEGARQLVPDLHQRRAKLAKEEDIRQVMTACIDASAPLVQQLTSALERLLTACETRDNAGSENAGSVGEYEEALRAARSALSEARRPFENVQRVANDE
jgi:dienelactone hydrolase